jgi:hypothetical protein
LKGERQAVVKEPQHRHFIRRYGATERTHFFCVLKFGIQESAAAD